jgi:hypothetical protein
MIESLDAGSKASVASLSIMWAEGSFLFKAGTVHPALTMTRGQSEPLSIDN